MFIFYQNPYFDMIGAICGIATLMAMIGSGMVLIDGAYETKDSLNVGITLVSATIRLLRCAYYRSQTKQKI